MGVKNTLTIEVLFFVQILRGCVSTNKKAFSTKFRFEKIHLSQLVSAIWSKYLQLQGGDIATQRQLLDKDKEIFQRDKEIQQLTQKIEDFKRNSSETSINQEFQTMLDSGKISDFINLKDIFLNGRGVEQKNNLHLTSALAFDLLRMSPGNFLYLDIKGKEFFKWYILTQLPIIKEDEYEVVP